MRHVQGANDAVATSSEVLEERERVLPTSSLEAGSSAASEELLDIESSSSASLNTSVELDVSTDDVAVECANPNKIKRSLPLRLKAHDPAQCTDILDSMYELYYEYEVRTCYFST